MYSIIFLLSTVSALSFHQSGTYTIMSDIGKFDNNVINVEMENSFHMYFYNYSDNTICDLIINANNGTLLIKLGIDNEYESVKQDIANETRIKLSIYWDSMKIELSHNN